MNLVTVGIGALAVGFGLFTLFMRATNPQSFSKLQAMKKQFGDTAGTVVHTIAYSVMPIAIGVILIVRGVMGTALF